MAEQIYEKLKKYCHGEMYPFHMPGHKRNPAFFERLPGSEIDITEIEGFDNLHHAEGILKEAQRRAAKIYGVKETFYSVNGSTAALLAAISASVPAGGKILVARNCHKAVYHAIYLRNLIPVYVYPQWNNACGLNGGILPSDVEKMLKNNPDIKAVILTSPTYDGIVSDIRSIAGIVHEYKIPLLVDEAHGAHFPFSDFFPKSAIEMGADIVIHSVHKTLPSLTQTALLHQVTERVDRDLLVRFMGIYQSSSPSYLLMGAIDSCISFLEKNGKNALNIYAERLKWARCELKELQNIKIPGKELEGSYGIYDIDLSKIILSVKKCNITGIELHNMLRKMGFEMEMDAVSYVLALGSVGDTREGIEKFVNAVKIIDGEIKKKNEDSQNELPMPPVLTQELIPSKAMDWSYKQMMLEQSAGEISGELVYLYPPGIPILVPGEKITEEIIQYLKICQRAGMELQGLNDYSGNCIRVVLNE